MNTLSFIFIEPKMLKTEERILLAAMEVFSIYPLEAVSLRTIAKKAEVTLSSITYHFKTKENLYQEVLCRVLSYMTDSIATNFEELDADDLPDPETASERLEKMIGYLVDRFCTTPHSQMFAKIIVREHFSPTPVYESLYRDYFKKVVDYLTLLVMAITGEDDRRDASLRAFIIFGQIIGMRLERELLVRHVGLDFSSPEGAEELKNLLTQSTLAQLTASTVLLTPDS